MPNQANKILHREQYEILYNSLADALQVIIEAK